MYWSNSLNILRRSKSSSTKYSKRDPMWIILVLKPICSPVSTSTFPVKYSNRSRIVFLSMGSFDAYLEITDLTFLKFLYSYGNARNSNKLRACTKRDVADSVFKI